MTTSFAAASGPFDVIRDALIPTAGGDLAADVFLPRTNRPVPALVTLLPYNKDWIAGAEAWYPARFFAEHGYASVLVDFLGTGGSSGRARPPFAADESGDGVAAVEWAASQDWCDGAVGMWGVSYGAITSLRTAARRPPALKAIAPILGHLDPERDFVHPSGRRGCIAPLGWALVNLLLQLMPPRVDDEARWRRVWQERLDRADPYLVDLVRHAPNDPAWRSRAIDVANIQVPSFCVAGWRDLFVDGMMRAYEQISAPKKLLAGPWMHVPPDASSVEPVRFLPMLVRWWDRWLRDVPNGIDHEPPVTLFVQQARRWVSPPAWPPHDLGRHELRPGPDGRLAAHASAGSASVPPDATVGVDGGLQYFQSSGFGLPQDQRPDERRALTFTSDPLAEPLTVVGRPRLVVHADEGSDAAFVVKLSDVHSDGRSVMVTAGISSGSRIVEMSPTAYRFEAGHRVRLLLSCGDFPRLWPADPGASFSLALGDGATVLQLPVLPEGAGLDVALPAEDPARIASPLVFDVDAPEYQVERDPSRDAVTVRISGARSLRTPEGTAVVRMSDALVATVASGSPGSARFEGSAAADVETPAGAFRLDVQITVTAKGATALGTVLQGNETVFTRRWSA